MTLLTRSILAQIFAFALLAGAPAANAADLPINAFYGHFQGSGIADNSDSLYFGVTVRDLDVRISSEGPGFFVEWTSVIRGGGNPDKPDVRKRKQRMSFLPSGQAGVFNAVGAHDPRSPLGLSWTSIKERTLTVNVMRITAAGGYVIQTYDRTLEGTGMRLKFTNVSNGEPKRQVDARLVKVGD